MVLARKARVLSMIVAIIMALSVFAAAGAMPSSKAYAAGETLTVNMSPANLTGYVDLLIYDSQNDRWYYESGGSINAGKATINVEYMLNKTATLVYFPDTFALRKVYGNEQTLGGWFGDTNDDGAKFTKIVTGNKAVTFAPAKGAVFTLKVTPTMKTKTTTDSDGYPSTTYLTQIYPYAYQVTKGVAGRPELQGIEYIRDYDQDYPADGVYTFVVKPGQTYAFAADGYQLQGDIRVPYEITWLGGNVGGSTDTPKKIKKIKAGKAGSTKKAGTIKLVYGKSTIKGVTKPSPDSDTNVGASIDIINPFTHVSYSIQANAKTGAFTAKVEPGFYIVLAGNNEAKFVAVKKGKKANVKFSKALKPKYDSWGEVWMSIKVDGAVKAGSKLSATTKYHNLSYGEKKAPKAKYIWTDGIKILSKKATYKVSKAAVKKGKHIFVIAYATKYGYTNYNISKVY